MLMIKQAFISKGGTIQLIIINVVVFVVIMAMSFLWPAPAITSALSLPCRVSALLLHPWTLATYMFVHYGFWHLAVNMLWLLMFGRVLELTCRSSFVWRMYLAGGLAGGVLFLLAASTIGGTGLYLTGASASVSALISCSAMRSGNLEVNLFLIGPVRLKWVAIAALVLLLAGGGGGGLWAHLGGAAAGMWPWMYKRIGAPRRPDWMSLEHWKQKRRLRATTKAFMNRKRDNDRLNELIDKIRVSGHEALTEQEKSELSLLSRRLSNK